MSSRRVLKVARAIREVVGMAILTELRDPRIRDVTVTRVEVTPDLQQAKVYISVMGDEAKESLSLHGLQSAAGHLQAMVNRRIDMRYTPRLVFVIDKGVKNAAAIEQILRNVLPRPAEEPAAEEGEPELLEDDAAEEIAGSDFSTDLDTAPPDADSESDEER